MFELIVRYQQALGDALLTSLQLCAVAWISGLLIGGSVGFLVGKSNRIVQVGARAIYLVFMACPVLVILYWFHFPFQKLLGVVIDPFYTAALTMSLVNIVGVANVVQDAVSKFPSHFAHTARVTGVFGWEYVRRIQLPIIFKRIYPSVLLLQVSVVHISLFASMIAVPELFRVAQRINAIEHRSIEIYTIMAIFFIGVLVPVVTLANRARNRVDYNESEI